MGYKFSKEYLNNYNRLVMHSDFIDGSVSRVSSYLRRLNIENASKIIDGMKVGDIMFNARKERLANRNICEPILSYYLAYLSRELVYNEEMEDEPFNTILSNVDGSGQRFDTLARTLIYNLLGYGYTGALIESDGEPEQAQGRAIQKGERSYIAQFSALDILKLEREKKGAGLGKIKQLDLKTGQSEEGITGLSYTLVEGGYMRRDFLIKIDKDEPFPPTDSASEYLVEYGEPAIGELSKIPFVLIGNDLSESVIRLAVEKNVELLNKRSYLDAININQAFKRLFGFGVDEDDVKYSSFDVMSLVSDPNAKIQEIEPGNPQSLINDIEDIEREAYLEGTLKHGTRYQASTKAVESAETQRQNNAAFENYLSYLADMIEHGLNDIISIVYEFEKGQEPEEKNFIEISRDFNPAISAEETNRYITLYDMAADKGAVGQRIQNEIVALLLSEMRLVSSSRATSEETKSELIKGVKEYTQAEIGTGLLSNRFNEG